MGVMSRNRRRRRVITVTGKGARTRRQWKDETKKRYKPIQDAPLPRRKTSNRMQEMSDGVVRSDGVQDAGRDMQN
jgi:DNA-binding PadR family transcriptional regulator